jgi:hypothetical protein
MTHGTLEQIRPGWRVFLGADALGEVDRVDGGQIDVKAGGRSSEVFSIPTSLVAEADDGIVDLKADQETLDEVRAARGEATEAMTRDQASERHEYRQPGADRPDPLDFS